MTDYSHLPPPSAWSSPVSVAEPGSSSPAAQAPEGGQPRWPWIVAIVVVVVGLILALGNWAVRNYQYTELLTSIQKSELEMVAAQEDLRKILTEAAADVDSNRSSLEEDVADEIKELGVRASTAISSKRPAIANQTFPFWETEMLATQRDYLAHNQAWVTYWQLVAADPRVVLDSSGEDSEINTTWETATESMEAGKPLLAWPRINELLAAIISDEETPASGGQIA